MASYQSRRRDPLLDSTTQAAIEKRSKELLGIGLICLGLLIAVMVGSYSPDDPSWISATDAPVQNWLGHFGASVAAPLMMVIGLGTWVMPVILLTWG
ncbi:DNA translocase FtsK 4TM domain-containing protein, partial [Yoonia sp.]|nr:DNA translocase FtsK 4TM domain-containing protein [Yoonia sp.]